MWCQASWLLLLAEILSKKSSIVKTPFTPPPLGEARGMQKAIWLPAGDLSDRRARADSQHPVQVKGGSSDGQRKLKAPFCKQCSLIHRLHNLSGVYTFIQSCHAAVRIWIPHMDRGPVLLLLLTNFGTLGLGPGCLVLLVFQKCWLP